MHDQETQHLLDQPESVVLRNLVLLEEIEKGRRAEAVDESLHFLSPRVLAVVLFVRGGHSLARSSSVGGSVPRLRASRLALRRYGTSTSSRLILSASVLREMPSSRAARLRFPRVL